MTTLRIVHRAGSGRDSHRVSVSLEGERLAPQEFGTEFVFTFPDEEQGELCWYLEEYLQYPLDPAPKRAPAPPSWISMASSGHPGTWKRYTGWLCWPGCPALRQTLAPYHTLSGQTVHEQDPALPAGGENQGGTGRHTTGDRAYPVGGFADSQSAPGGGLRGLGALSEIRERG